MLKGNIDRTEALQKDKVGRQKDRQEVERYHYSPFKKRTNEDELTDRKKNTKAYSMGFLAEKIRNINIFLLGPRALFGYRMEAPN